jgi:hypothetical protein
MEKKRERHMNTHPNIGFKLAAAAIIASLLLALAACGKRDWPNPKLSEDKFRIRSMEVSRAKGCVIVSVELAGSWQNLQSMRVLLESVGDAPGDGCAQCPFVPRISRLYGLDAPELRRDLNRIVITTCGLDPAKTYRVQVVAGNIYPALSHVMSELKVSAPQ